MEGQRRPFPTRDWYLHRLAERQHGAVAWWQLRAAGFTRAQVDSRLARGTLQIVHRGVYSFGHARLTREGRWMAAVLALGEHAVLSHRSAAAHWSLLPASDSAFIHVAVPGRPRQRRRERILVHRRTGAADTTVHDGIPVTTVESTLLDLAATADAHTLRQALETAERLELFDRGAWTPPVGRPGAARLREAVGERRFVPTRSELERRFLQLCRDHGLPAPRTKAWVAGIEVDFLWPLHRLVVETDGAQHEGERESARDHDKEARLVLAGFHVQRFRWQQVVDEPGTVAAVVARLLDPWSTVAA